MKTTENGCHKPDIEYLKIYFESNTNTNDNYWSDGLCRAVVPHHHLICQTKS